MSNKGKLYNIGNLNAEKWNEKEATALFDDAIELSKSKEYDFIGEIASKLGTYKEIFNYLSDKFPELKIKSQVLHSQIESNCFYNTKKGNIREATGIVNLKSNYKWTDRTQTDQNTNISFDKETQNAALSFIEMCKQKD